MYKLVSNSNFDKFLDFLILSIKVGFFEMQINVVSSKTLISEIVAAISSERTTKQKSEGEIPNAEEYYTITF